MTQKRLTAPEDLKQRAFTILVRKTNLLIDYDANLRRMVWDVINTNLSLCSRSDRPTFIFLAKGIMRVGRRAWCHPTNPEWGPNRIEYWNFGQGGCWNMRRWNFAILANFYVIRKILPEPQWVRSCMHIVVEQIANQFAGYSRHSKGRRLQLSNRLNKHSWSHFRPYESGRCRRYNTFGFEEKRCDKLWAFSGNATYSS